MDIDCFSKATIMVEIKILWKLSTTRYLTVLAVKYAKLLPR